jgi:hypothetical protein
MELLTQRAFCRIRQDSRNSGRAPSALSARRHIKGLLESCGEGFPMFSRKDKPKVSDDACPGGILAPNAGRLAGFRDSRTHLASAERPPHRKAKD